MGIAFTYRGPCPSPVSCLCATPRCFRRAVMTAWLVLAGQFGCVFVAAHRPVMPMAVSLHPLTSCHFLAVSKSRLTSCVKWDCTSCCTAALNLFASWPMPSLICKLHWCAPSWANRGGVFAPVPSSNATRSSIQVTEWASSNAASAHSHLVIPSQVDDCQLASPAANSGLTTLRRGLYVCAGG